MKKHQRACGVAVAVSVLVGLASAHAEVPRLINYEGRFTESDGTPLRGSHTIAFHIYDAETGGTKLWEEKHTVSLTIESNGIFSILLGSLQPFGTLDFNLPLWLSLELDQGGEMTPRQRLTSVTYAINADTLDGLDSSQLLRADVDSVMSGQLKLTRTGTPLVIKPSATSAADTKLVDVQKSSGAAAFSVDAEGDAAVAGNLTVSGSINGSVSGGGTITGVTAGLGLTGGGTSGSVTVDVGAGNGLTAAADELSLKLNSSGPGLAVDASGLSLLRTCTGGQLLKWNATSSAWECAADTDTSSGGTVTSVDSGAGLTGGPITSSGTLAVGAGNGIQVNADDVAVKLSSGAGLIADGTGLSLLRTCANGELLKWNSSTPTWACSSDTDTNAGGDITSVTAGTGLTGGGTSGDVTVSLSTPVAVANGGTGASTLASGALLTGQGTSAVTTTSIGAGLEIASGQLNVDCMPIGGTSSDSQNATFEMGTFGGSDTGGELDDLWPVPQAGKVKTLSASVKTAPGSGDSWTVTVRKNDADTSLSCTISGSSKTCTASGTVSFATGDLLGVRFVEGGNASGTDGSAWGACFVPD